MLDGYTALIAFKGAVEQYNLLVEYLWFLLQLWTIMGKDLTDIVAWIHWHFDLGPRAIVTVVWNFVFRMKYTRLFLWTRISRELNLDP